MNYALNRGKRVSTGTDLTGEVNRGGQIVDEPEVVGRAPERGGVSEGYGIVVCH